VSPTPRAAAALAVCGLVALVVGPGLAIVLAVAVITATIVDAVLARTPVAVQRNLPAILSRGVPAALEMSSGARARLWLRQPRPAYFEVEPASGEGTVRAQITVRRRGRYELPGVAARREGPLGLARWDRIATAPSEVLVYPDLPAARRLVLAVRQRRLRETGLLPRGPLGLGTEFESVRDYLPDDDIRQVNWRATARLGRPMSNQYRVEQDRDLLLLLDTGRLMAAPTPTAPGQPADRTRLDIAVDAAAAVALTADELGDRCGVIAFAGDVRRQVSPRRRGGAAVVQAIFDLEPVAGDADYELAFRRVGEAKRAFVLVLSDLLEETAARPLRDAVPALARRHAVAVASVADPDLAGLTRRRPREPADVYATAIGLDVLGARARVASALAHTGAEVVEAAPEGLAAACVRAYMRAKRRGRL